MENLDFDKLAVKDNRFKKKVKGYALPEEKPWSKFAHFQEMDLESHTQDS